MTSESPVSSKMLTLKFVITTLLFLQIASTPSAFDPSPFCALVNNNSPSLSIPFACLRLRGGSDEFLDGECDEDHDYGAYDDDYGYDSDSEESDYSDDDENVRLSDKVQKQQRPRHNDNSGEDARNSSILAASSIVTAAAKKSIRLTQKTAEATLVQTGRAAYHLATPKHVSKSEIIGTWRIDQQVGLVGSSSKHNNCDENEDLPVVTCAANVELTESGEAIVRYSLPKNADDEFDVGYENNQTGEQELHSNDGDGDEIITSRSSYNFKERSWPRSCVIEFQLPAFHFPGDDHPVVMRYKGTLKRKLVDPSVIKIVGTIHEVGPPGRITRGPGMGGFWGNGNKSRRGKRVDKETMVGTFTARRRMGLEDNCNEEGGSEDDDEWDGGCSDEYDENADMD
eukprot:CAMPEP_0171349926 /NCGR_PEP_ID=MMETSP0878-20121228/35097_1 /TAXON_ID=67004 /ORGANISM="Thalassiosira weissflogii, Strain CCMP1336" /LENGTH=397 /DNA_ID=CAMNT_0011854717 /DNA_START=126 /DNA_END=1319 /DNA_ORIENTATION=-